MREELKNILWKHLDKAKEEMFNHTYMNEEIPVLDLINKLKEIISEESEQ